MTQPIHTGKFFVLEGLYILNMEMIILAVGFDFESMVEFARKLGQSGNIDFDAFRVSEHEGLDAVLAGQQRVPTHSAPVTSN